MKLLPALFISAICINQSHAAALFVDGSTDFVDIGNGAFFSGFSSGDTRLPSSFSSNFLSIPGNGNGQNISNALPLDDISIAVVGGNASFQFFFDSQETRNNEFIIFTEITLFYLTAAQVAANEVVDLGDALFSLGLGDQVHLNDATNPAGFTETDNPLGNGADAALSIPFSVFPATATSEDFVFLQVTLAERNNGPDEFTFATSFAADSPVEFITFANNTEFNSNLSIASAQLIPEPSSLCLLALCSAAGLLRRRR